jgi:polysaccharide biosynthesis/export protein
MPAAVLMRLKEAVCRQLFAPSFRTTLAGLALSGILWGQYAGPAVSRSATSFSAPASRGTEFARDTPILAGDTIRLVTVGAPELTIDHLQVSSAGTIALPYLGTFAITGQTGSASARLLSDKLKTAGFLTDPQITVELTNSPSRVITVLGEVKDPKPTAALSQLHLLDVISSCGGFTAAASHTLTVQRTATGETLTIRLSVDPRMSDETNILLQPGDTVIVPKVGSVFIVGQVRAEQAISLQGNEPITVMRAIALSGGLKYGASLAKARIVRGIDPASRKELALDLKKIMDGKQADPILVANDVLYIPMNPVKAGLANGGAAVAATSIYGLGSLAK